MQFIVIAYDGTDEGALERRLAVRDAHLKSAKEIPDDINTINVEIKI